MAGGALAGISLYLASSVGVETREILMPGHIMQSPSVGLSVVFTGAAWSLRVQLLAGYWLGLRGLRMQPWHMRGLRLGGLT